MTSLTTTQIETRKGTHCQVIERGTVEHEGAAAFSEAWDSILEQAGAGSVSEEMGSAVDNECG